MKNKIMMQCASAVSSVRRESINGVEHVIISSFTLPDNIVMNGGLYPADEIEKSFGSLERTLAPVEHPQDADGNFISASDPLAIHNYHAGAFNMNVTRKDGRIHIEKFVNVQEALKTDRGRRVLDRVNEIETSNDPRPIHTSVGVFLIANELDEPKTNAAGNEYTWVASEMVFDHDAILLDSVGAAQPSQGVGMAVNYQGEECEVQTFVINAEIENDPVPDAAKMSHEEIRDALHDAIQKPPFNGDWISQVFDTEFIFESGDLLFSVPYTIDNGIAMIVGIPLPVERDVTFKPKVNNKGDAMKEVIVKALATAGVETKDLDDTQLLAAYDKLQANQSNDDNEESGDAAADVDSIASAVNSALEPVVNKLNDLESKLNAKNNDELNKYAEIVGNSDKYAGLTVDMCKTLKLDDLKTMAANCASGHALPMFNNNSGGDDSTSVASLDMPE